MSNCAFFKEGLVPGIDGSLVLILAVVIFDAANDQTFIAELINFLFLKKSS